MSIYRYKVSTYEPLDNSHFSRPILHFMFPIPKIVPRDTIMFYYDLHALVADRRRRRGCRFVRFEPASS